MRPIKYPVNIDIIESYYVSNLVKSSEIKLDKINFYLNKVNFNSKKLSFEDLLVYPLHNLLQIEELINLKLSKLQRMRLNSLFNYKKHQDKIADFFMNKSCIDLNSCYYCNIDYINPFLDLADFDDPLKFINSANHIELQNLVGVGIETAKKIIAKKPTGGYKKIINIPSLKLFVKYQLNFLHFNNTHNHFTLDHFIPQSDNKFLSLCLYNFVPSCYSCNSKFKSDKKFSDNTRLIYVCPTSNSFSMHNELKFRIYYSNSLANIKNEKDFTLQLDGSSMISNEFKAMFKLEGRYIYHKKIIPKLVKNKLNYSESRIKEISTLVGQDEKEIKKTIFGEELFEKDLTNEPLVKFKRDIAKDLNIKDVI